MVVVNTPAEAFEAVKSSGRAAGQCQGSPSIWGSLKVKCPKHRFAHNMLSFKFKSIGKK